MADTKKKTALRDEPPVPSTSVVISDPPYIVGSARIVRLDTKQLTASQHLAALRLALAGQVGGNYKKLWTAEEVRLSITAITDAGASVKLSTFEIGEMPSCYGIRIHALCTNDTSPVGGVINKGDGSSTPVLFRLGTPLRMMKNGEDMVIEEIEFMVSKYSQIIDVLSVDIDIEQAMALAMSCARGVGPDGSFVLHPSAVENGLMRGDLYAIRNAVLPSFLLPHAV